MSVVNVGNLLFVVSFSMNIREFTLTRGLMNALKVGSPLEQILISLNTVEFILEKSLINAVNVGNLFRLCPASVSSHRIKAI